MKQILQNLGSGETILAEVPEPRRSRGAVLIHTTRSLVSLGTEKMLIDFGKGSLIAKARSQPDKVKQVLQKIKTDGLWTTLDAVKAKLDTPIPLGYCNVGKVVEADSASRFAVGDRVVSNGHHAETVSVGQNLTAKIPDSVGDDEAAFAVVGAIGLQGIRLIQPTIGEFVVVSGLGLIGQLAIQILRANGCQVLGVDYDAAKLQLAKQFGAEVCDLSAGQDPVAVAEAWTRGQGVDAVLIAASTKSDTVIHQAATMCRPRGRIVLVGVIGLNLQRADFYEKELTFQVSCSYGPGRYDESYEKRGFDYPIGFVRWTEQRNFEAVLQLMAEGKIDVSSLITHRFKFDDALSAYQSIGDAGAMGILLEYDDVSCPTERGALGADLRSLDKVTKSTEKSTPASPLKRDVSVAFIGAGGFTTRMLMPLLPKQGVRRYAVSSGSGVSAAYAKNKFSFEIATSDSSALMSDPQVDAVIITTPHHLHAAMVCESLENGKHVFVEKPLAITNEELKRVRDCASGHPDQLLMVGFNRRFSPHMKVMKEWSQSAASNKAVIITVNAGAIPEKHWTQDPETGGGRIIGEACHFIDTARFLIGSPLVSADGFPVVGGDGRLGDCVNIQLTFEDGSVASIHYLANGNKSFPKERIELFCSGQVFLCDNFRTSVQVGSRNRLKTPKQDKGHAEEIRAFLAAVAEGGPSPISRSELFQVSQAAIDVAP
ncbi:MAG: bi-domain-containing oxidoreductase [Planctomycetales bacterium]|nr:bi-domain-containing oxidoreductase [Planctomycetales bacterium]